jgi:hypothetical protein
MLLALLSTEDQHRAHREEEVKEEQREVGYS